MEFRLSARAEEYKVRLESFMEECVYPAEAKIAEEMRVAGNPHHHPQELENLKEEAKSRGLWNLFHPHPNRGPALSNLEYAPLAEIMGRSPHIAPEACNCSAPDTGNMEILELFGTDEHRRKWLEPLLDGTIRSAFCMTEPDISSSDATNVSLRMEAVPGGYVLNGRKWFASNAMHQNLQVLIVMGKTSPDAPTHKQQSMLVVPADAPGVKILRNLPVFGYHDREGHGEISFENVFVPEEDILLGEGRGFEIAQARLGPGRIHHCMRAIGMAERALELMCQRALERSTFGKPLANRDNIREWIARSRINIEMTRLLTLKAAWMMDEFSNKEARQEIAAIKVAAPSMALDVVDKAIQVFGGEGVTEETPLAQFWAGLRSLRLADGPDEVHLMTIARAELKKYQPTTKNKPAPFDLGGLSAWLESLSGATQGPVDISRLGTGHSNLTYKAVDSAGRTVVVRRPPLGALAESAHDVARESRIMDALANTAVPVPKILGVAQKSQFCDAPVAAMELVAGTAITSSKVAEALDPAKRARIGAALIDVMVDIHSVDIDEVGLGELSSRSPYAERQLRRWHGQWEKTKTRESAELEALTERLRKAIPQQQRTTLVHGDLHLGNLMCDLDTAEVTAVVDWELATLGDPLSDIGSLLAYWPSKDGLVLPGFDAALAEGFPTGEQLAARYLEKTGARAEDLQFWHVLGLWKVAIIAEGVVRRVQNMPDNAAPSGAPTAEMVDRIISYAIAVANSYGIGGQGD